MDKNIIRKYLNETFVSEALASEVDGTPAIKLKKKLDKEETKINKTGVKDVGKDMKTYEGELTKPDTNEDTMGPNKFNYDSKSEETYHDEMEIMNGQEMIQYDRKPNKQFTDRAIEAIEGSSKMGNNPEWANVVAKGQGGDPEFGKNLVKKIKDSEKKRNEQTPTMHLQGRDIEADRKDYGNKPYAFENIHNAAQMGGITTSKGTTGYINNTSKMDKDYSNSIRKSGTTKEESVDILKNKKTTQIKESMKRLKFKKEFKGVGNALKMIPESYKTDMKVFEMTDGNESYKIRWEGSLTEGKAIILTAADKNMVNEDIQKMRHLMGYKSETTLGNLKGNARLDENKAFADVYAKTKKLLGESEDIEDQDAEKVAPFEEADVNQAAEAKKHVEGSVSTEKGTKAPKPKSGEWEKISVPHAAEAKKHIQGSTSADKGTQAPKPKSGDLDKAVSPAPEAKKDIKGSVKETAVKKK